MPTPNYLVCSTVRSGSTLLCKTLEKLDECGKPQEYFHRHLVKKLKLQNNPQKFLEYCDCIVREGIDNHGTFGIKMHWYQLVDFFDLARQCSHLTEKTNLEILNILFSNLKFIYLWRSDIEAQAISAAIASQTGVWEKSNQSLAEKPEKNKKTPKTAMAKTIKFQPWKIYEWERSLQYQNQCWQRFFTDNHLKYHEMNYENLVESFNDEVIKVVNYVGASFKDGCINIVMPTKRQSDAFNTRFMAYYKMLPKLFLAAIYWVYCLKHTRALNN